MAYTILHNVEFDCAKRDSLLAAYEDVVLQEEEYKKEMVYSTSKEKT